MSFHELRAYSEAIEYAEALKTIQLMNAVGMAQGTQQERQRFVDALLGIDSEIEFENFDALFGMSTANDNDPQRQELIDWARQKFAEDDSFIK